jgi:hypothetical protein
LYLGCAKSCPLNGLVPEIYRVLAIFGLQRCSLSCTVFSRLLLPRGAPRAEMGATSKRQQVRKGGNDKTTASRWRTTGDKAPPGAPPAPTARFGDKVCDFISAGPCVVMFRLCFGWGHQAISTDTLNLKIGCKINKNHLQPTTHTDYPLSVAVPVRPKYGALTGATHSPRSLRRMPPLSCARSLHHMPCLLCPLATPGRPAPHRTVNVARASRPNPELLPDSLRLFLEPGAVEPCGRTPRATPHPPELRADAAHAPHPVTPRCHTRPQLQPDLRHHPTIARLAVVPPAKTQYGCSFRVARFYKTQI